MGYFGGCSDSEVWLTFSIYFERESKRSCDGLYAGQRKENKDYP